MSENTVTGPGKTREAGTAHGIVLLMAAVMPIMAITALIPVLPLLLREYAAVPGSQVLVPMALTIPALCVALFSPVAGWLSDRFGRKRLLVGSLTIYSITGFLPWFLEGLQAIIAARIGLGVMEALIMTLSTALIGDYFTGQRRERWIAAQIAVGSLAATVLVGAGGALGEVLGSRGPFLLYLSGLVVALAAAIILHEPVQPQKSQSKVAGSGSSLLPILPLVLITFAVGIIFYTVLVQTGPILELSGPVSTATVGLVGALINLGVVIGAGIFKLASARTGPQLLALGLVLSAAGYVGIAVSDSLVALAASAMIACIGTGIMLPNMLNWTMRSLPDALRGSGMGIWTGAFFLGQFIAPIAVGAVAGQVGGLGEVIKMMAGFVAVAALAAIVVAWISRNAASESKVSA